jgi:hypothetical protein
MRGGLENFFFVSALEDEVSVLLRAPLELS